MFIRRSLLVLTAATVVLSFASPVLAHVDPDPEEAQAGSQLSVGFTVQHGCDGSPTVQLDMRLPEGVTGAQPEPPEGWTGTVESDVITFTGGPLPDDQELTFRVLMTLPPTPDTTIYFRPNPGVEFPNQNPALPWPHSYPRFFHIGEILIGDEIFLCKFEDTDKEVWKLTANQRGVTPAKHD